VEQAIEITGEMIRLGQLLKLAGAASGGAGAKALIADGQVTVNGEPELRRGRQLHPGDIVCVGSGVLRIVSSTIRHP
jgi:ribosome-associated protein